MKKFSKIAIAFLLAGAFAVAPICENITIVPNFSITVQASSILSAPENITTSSGSDYITISWDAVPGAGGYKIYMYDETKGDYINYKNVAANSCKVTSLAANKEYQFKVSTLAKNENGTYDEHCCSPFFTAKTTKSQTKSQTKSSKYPAAPSANYTGFASSGNKKYYYEKGKFITGFKKIDSDYYYFTESGMLTGWLNYYGLYYYFGTDGKMVKSKTLSFNGTKYEFESDGHVAWYKSTKEPTANYTVKGDDLNISIWMSSKTKINANSVVLLISNKGDKDLTVYTVGLSDDNTYSSYDRTLALLNSNYEYDGIPQVIKANSSENVLQFAFVPDSTWYDKKTEVTFFVKYDNTTYKVITSSYYGTKYYQAHYNLDK